MDRLVRARGVRRTMVTKLITKITMELDKGTAASRFELCGFLVELEKLGTSTQEFDLQIEGLMLDADATQEELESEHDATQEYQLKISTAKCQLQQATNPAVVPPTSHGGSEYSESSTTKKRTYKLPKTEIKKFKGDVTEWLSWWSQFEKIHDDEDLHDSDKFQYLSQAMVEGSRAAAVVKIYPQTSANYPKAVQALKDRFGKEKTLKRVYVRELLKLIIKNSREKVKISETFDKLEGHLKALESLGVSPDQMDVILFPMVESCLPDEILVAWQRSSNYGKEDKTSDPPKTEFDFLLEFVKQEVENEGDRKMANDGFGITSKDKSKDQESNRPMRVRSDPPTAASLYTTQDNQCCVFCGRSNHQSHVCYSAKKMTLGEKNNAVKAKKVCFRCLKGGHRANSCNIQVQCQECKKPHYLLMCPQTKKEKECTTEEVTDDMKNLTMSSTNQRWKKVLMKTLHVIATGPQGQEMNLRLLFDEGSQRSYIKSAVATKLGFPVIESLTLQNNLFGGQRTQMKSYKCYEVQLKGVHTPQTRKLKLINEDVICSSCPIVPPGPWLQELKKKRIYLTDTWADSPEVEILIGSDLWGHLMTGRMEKLNGGLVAVESIFGWTLSGEINHHQNNNCAMTVISMLTTGDRPLQDMWTLETLGIRDSAEQISQEEHDHQVKKNLQESVTRDPEGRYVVKLPWLDQSIHLPSNENIAQKRLTHATEKLKKQSEFDNYDGIFRGWEEEGIVEKILEKSTKDHYLPHRPVFKPESLTTPVRPVFDASCKVGKNPSLNQCLEKGPNLLELIPSILLRFREKKVGVIADIRKAFQMIGVAEEDRDFQKFLWWDNEKEKILRVYRHCRVVFGMNCSPFILAAVLEFHLKQVDDATKTVAELLLKSLYVDNVVVSLNNEGEYQEFKKKSVATFQDAKMELRQWETNLESSTVNNITTVLGLRWDKVEDTLYCQPPPMPDPETPVNKRRVLSLVSQMFDPIGFICPALLQPKLMLQDSWAVEMDWDKEWGPQEKEKFKIWCEDLPEIQKIHIPRIAIGGNSPEDIQIHMFSDASQTAYAAVVFARVQHGDRVEVQLLLAKSRLAPLDKKKSSKRVTIPRLELMGCLIGARLAKSVTDSLALEEVPHFYWSDSTTALAWIRRNEDWGTFVGNRAREINRLSSSHQWRHVPGQLNPADLPSRGCSPSELVESSWWEGPIWLKESEENWPSHCEETNEEEILDEAKKTVATSVATPEMVEPRFSSYLKNVRVAAWIRRFINNCKIVRRNCWENSGVDPALSGCGLEFATEKSTKKIEHLTLDELRVAEVDIIRNIQQRNYPGPPVIKPLQIEEIGGLLHVKTRLDSREDTRLFRRPYLLPNSDPMVHQLIQQVHRENCHAGTQFVLGRLREKYWILQGRKTVSRIIHKCATCRRHHGRSVQVDPAPLPPKRVETQFAFQTTGVDLAGPWVLKGGKKAWGVIYTCAVYRGVYLDILDSISTEEFLGSLEKFTQLVGRPSTIYTDNGTNFVGTDNLLKRLNYFKVDVPKINWIFNPPTAAWWGGWWERLVRTLKELLRKMIGATKLTRKELDRCLAAISYTMNNRPLTTLTEDPEDLTPLTPASFMRDLPVGGMPELEKINPKDLQEAWKKNRDLKQHLQNRFRKEYLAQLVQKKSEVGKIPLRVDDVVLIGADNKKRYEWPLGRIVELIPGKDGKIRVARVRTTHGILLRPLQRLYPLEVRNQEIPTQDIPKDIPIPPIQDIQKEEEPIKDQNQEKIPPTIRGGRRVRRPVRYGSWNQ